MFRKNYACGTNLAEEIPKTVMRETNDNQRKESRVKDPHLDIPSEANTDEHINFLEIEEPGTKKHKLDRETEERQKQWREGLEEGEKERNRD